VDYLAAREYSIFAAFSFEYALVRRCFDLSHLQIVNTKSVLLKKSKLLSNDLDRVHGDDENMDLSDTADEDV